MGSQSFYSVLWSFIRKKPHKYMHNVSQTQLQLVAQGPEGSQDAYHEPLGRREGGAEGCEDVSTSGQNLNRKFGLDYFKKICLQT